MEQGNQTPSPAVQMESTSVVPKNNRFLMVLISLGVLILLMTIGWLFYQNRLLRKQISSIQVQPEDWVEPATKNRVTQPVSLTSTPSHSEIPAGDIPVTVGYTVSGDWFASWARPTDVLVYFGGNIDDSFSSLPALSAGMAGWNVPSFAQVIETESQWSGKIGVILYDYETWDKTPADEQADPDWASSRAQEFADQRGLTLIMGSSWRMITRRDPNILWGKIDQEKVRTIAKNVKNYGFNATGLRRENPEGFVEWYKTAAATAKSANPAIKTWLVLDSGSQTVSEMMAMVEKLTGYVDGVSLTGNNKEVISQFVSSLRR